MLVALIPFRSSADGKLRLAGSMGRPARTALLRGMLERTVAAATGASSVDATVVVSGDEWATARAAEMGSSPVADPGGGLNVALETARRRALEAGATAILVLPTDLLALTPAAIDDLVAAVLGAEASSGSEGATVGIVPDRHGTGTNALLLAPASVIGFRFGVGSCAAHVGEARAAGARVVRADGPLGFDLDTPEDYRDAVRSGMLAAADGVDLGERGEPRIPAPRHGTLTMAQGHTGRGGPR